MPPTRYKKRKGFENRLKALARHSRESKQPRAWSIEFGWANNYTLRTFTIYVGTCYQEGIRLRVTGRLVRNTVTKWCAQVSETCGLLNAHMPGFPDPREVGSTQVSKTFATTKELLAYVRERDEEIKFELELLKLNV
jgi:hypothetical protein